MQVTNITKYYGSKIGIKDVSFTVHEGMILGILGHNGSGKSTLFKSIIGYIPRNYGSVELNQGIIGYVPENRSLYQDVSVESFLRFMGKLHRVNPSVLEKRITDWLRRFGIEANRKKKIQTLSKGNQQKIQFIAALVHDPDILILDEPMSGLDSTNMNLIRTIIGDLSQKGIRIILSSHQYDELETFCDAIVVLKQGHVMLQGDVRTLKRRHDQCYLSVSYDKHRRYQHEKGMLAAETFGNQTRYTFKDQKSMEHMFRKCLEDRDVSTLKIESISLKDMVAMYYE